MSPLSYLVAFLHLDACLFRDTLQPHHRVMMKAFTEAPPKLGRPAFRAGGDDGNRTHDPLLAGQVLSQLSYTPIPFI